MELGQVCWDAGIGEATNVDCSPLLFTTPDIRSKLLQSSAEIYVWQKVISSCGSSNFK